MNNKKVFSSELAYLGGLAFLVLGTALMEWVDFGMSMVVAPAYLLYLKLSQVLPFFTFGMAEYCLQGLLLVLLGLVTRHWSRRYLYSLLTAVLYGLLLDLAMWCLAQMPPLTLFARQTVFPMGMISCALGVSLLFHTYLPPEAYELFVKDLSEKFGWNVAITKTVYDVCSCLLAVSLSFAFFGWGRFEGVKVGTAICAALNGTLIGFFNKALEISFRFEDKLPLRDHFA